ncbi:MAG: hypothetical protein Tp172SUR151031_38 [Prokaryotic dsDNA virus sp.]|nr:MAG: hypothetical protein Tp172SUR151031_38 [Prokaryotic dsDNA virus sp.]|tara:strand:+ start:5915 stop:8272 length:2358 start_codon:yes stop_codon:yes gene_type:complete
MPFSSGTFSRVHDFTDDRDNGIKIQAARMDAEMDGIATALTTTILKDGTQTCTAAIPFAEGITIPDNKTITFGTNSDITVQYDETTNDSLEIAANVEGAALGIVLKSDQGDDAGDEWKLNVADGGTITFGNDIASAGTYVTHLTIAPNATVTNSTMTVAGNLTVASEIDGASLDISGNADIDGTLEADAMTLNGSAITTTATLSTGISNGNVLVATSGIADNDFLKVDGTSIEGRSAAEVLSDIGGQASLTFGISNTNAVKIDSASVADDEYARFTANGLESRSTSEVLSDIGASAAAGSSSIVTTGALDSGSITSGFGAIDNGTSGIRTNTFTAETSFVPDAQDGAALGTSSLQFSDLFLADGAVVSFGDDNEITLTHVADSGLTLKHAASGDDKFPTLLLAAGDNDIAADDKLGVVSFVAPDESSTGDAQLVAASIQARSEGDFSSSSNATSLDFMTGASETATTKMTIKSNGNVGIGTTSPGNVLDVEGSNATAIGIDITNAENSKTLQISKLGSSYNAHGASAGEAWIYDPDNINIGSATGNSGGIKLLSEGAARLVVTGEHVGVGTTAPDKSGQFGGTQVSLNVTGSAAPEVRIKSNSSDADTALISSNSSHQFFIINGANGVSLAHDGNSFGSVSDERKKDIIENITNAEEKINKLRAVIGKYKVTKTYESDVLYTQEEKDDGQVPDGKDVGDVKIAKGTKRDGDKDDVRRSFLIAQDFLNNFPDVVSEVPEINNDGNETSNTYYQLEYQGVIPLLVAGIKELSAKCADYEKRIKALEG